MSIESVQDMIERYGYFAVGVGGLLDQSGLNAWALAGGAAAALMHERFALWAVILAGAAGGIVSDMLWYGVGRWRAGWLDRVVRGERGRERLAVMREALARRAFVIVAFGRFLPWIGRFTPATAGLQRMGLIKTLVASVPGALIASTIFSAMGFAAAHSLETVEGVAFWIGLAGVGLSVVATAYFLRRLDRAVDRRLRGKSAPGRNR